MLDDWVLLGRLVLKGPRGLRVSLVLVGPQGNRVASDSPALRVRQARGVSQVSRDRPDRRDQEV